MSVLERLWTTYMQHFNQMTVLSRLVMKSLILHEVETWEGKLHLFFSWLWTLEVQSRQNCSSCSFDFWACALFRTFSCSFSPDFFFPWTMVLRERERHDMILLKRMPIFSGADQGLETQRSPSGLGWLDSGSTWLGRVLFAASSSFQVPFEILTNITHQNPQLPILFSKETILLVATGKHQASPSNSSLPKTYANKRGSIPWASSISQTKKRASNWYSRKKKQDAFA